MRSSIVKKFLMSVSGLFYCLFLLGHLSGNLLLYVGEKAFNDYADFLSSTSFIYVAEFVLVVMIAIHIITAIQLTRENRKARPQKYAVNKSFRQRTFASSHMIHSGSIILIFIIIHIYSFKFGDWSNAPDSEMTLYDLVALRFSNIFYAGGYVIAMILLGMHLHHAIKSACHTLGVYKNNRFVLLISNIFSIVVALGFISFPLYFYLLSIM